MKDKKLLIEGFYTTFATFILIWLFTFLPFNLKIFDPVKKAFGDFEFTDLYFSELRSKTATDKDIVMVDLDTASRGRIAEVIEIIARHHPAVIGLDAYFLERKDAAADQRLRNALESNTEKMVIAGRLVYDGGNVPSALIGSHPFFGEHKSGYVNFVSAHETTGAIRYFRPAETFGEREISSFSVEIVKKFDPELARRCLERNERSMLINYLGGEKQFTTISQAEIDEANAGLSVLDGKIVLLGLTGDPAVKNSLEDSHFTPMNEELSGKSFPDSYGLVIHANIISMMLRGDYITRVPFLLNLLIAVVITYLHSVLYSYYFVKRHVWFHLVAKLTQFAVSVVFLYIVILMLGSFNIKFDSGLTLAGILLIVDVLYFYEAFRARLYRKYHLASYFVHEHH